MRSKNNNKNSNMESSLSIGHEKEEVVKDMFSA